MLLTFKTQAYADITMFADVAMRFLKMMGLSTNVPGALLAKDIPQALATLEARLAEELVKDAEQDMSDKANDDDDEVAEPAVGLRRQAFPLLELLKAANAKGKDVLWEASGV